MELLEKLEILTDAAKYDAACTSSGVRRSGRAGYIGNTSSSVMGCCHTFSATMNLPSAPVSPNKFFLLLVMIFYHSNWKVTKLIMICERDSYQTPILLSMNILMDSKSPDLLTAGCVPAKGLLIN